MGRKKKNEKNQENDVLNVAIPDSERSSSQEGDLKTALSASTNPNELSDELQKELKRFLIPKLRSASYRWKFRSQAIKDARKERGIYECAMCKGEFRNGEFILDHVHPVVPLEGWDGRDWTQYINRMFCGTEGFQVLCKSCSTIKTNFETEMRKINRAKKKS